MNWNRRLEEFAERKTREALEATLRPFTTEVDNGSQPLLPLGSAWTRSLFDGDFYLSPAPSSDDRSLPAPSLVFVQSRDGNTGAKDPSALGGGDTDKHLVYEGLSRVAADGVIAGAETIRGGDVVFSVWHPEVVALRAGLGLARHPVQIVATLKGLRFNETLLFNIPELPVIILTVRECVNAMQEELAERPWIAPVTMASRVDLPAAFSQLRRLGIRRISAVGGRTLARALINAGLIQDLYLTTSNTAGGEPNTPLSETPLHTCTVVRKHGTGEDAGVVFEHLALPVRLTNPTSERF